MLPRVFSLEGERRGGWTENERSREGKKGEDFGQGEVHKEVRI